MAAIQFGNHLEFLTVRVWKRGRARQGSTRPQATTKYDVRPAVGQFCLTFDEMLGAVDEMGQSDPPARFPSGLEERRAADLPPQAGHPDPRRLGFLHPSLIAADATTSANALSFERTGPVAGRDECAGSRLHQPAGCQHRKGWRRGVRGGRPRSAPMRGYNRGRCRLPRCRNWGGITMAFTSRLERGRQEARLEHRMADASAWAYAAVAAVLQAARLGFEGGYALPPIETGECFTGQTAPHGVGASLARDLDDHRRPTFLRCGDGRRIPPLPRPQAERLGMKPNAGVRPQKGTFFPDPGSVLKIEDERFPL